MSPAILRAGGEEGFIDLVALHPARGVALIALLDAGEEASPDEARAAFRAMLEESGFPLRFSGELPVLALAERRAEAEQLAAAVEQRFASLPRVELPAEWVDWVAGRLMPPPAEKAPLPRLTAVREEPPPAAETALPPLIAAREEEPPAAAPETPLPALTASQEPSSPAPAELLVIPEPPLDAAVVLDQAPPPRRSWLDHGASLGFSLGIVLVLLFGLAVLTQAVRMF